MSTDLEETPANATQHDVTTLLQAWSTGDPKAFERLWPIVYEGLRRVASRRLAGERQGHSLQTHDLIHEAFLKLAGTDRMQWRNRTHFFAVSAQAMRRILIDYARRRSYAKRDGGQRLPLDDVILLSEQRAPELLALDAALRDLAGQDETLGQIVELRYFGGLTHDEIGDFLGTSTRTVRRKWHLARAWLFDQLDHASSS